MFLFVHVERIFLCLPTFSLWTDHLLSAAFKNLKSIEQYCYLTLYLFVRNGTTCVCMSIYLWEFVFLSSLAVGDEQIPVLKQTLVL